MMKKLMLSGLMLVSIAAFSQKPTTYRSGQAVVTVWENQKTGVNGDYTEKVYEVDKIYKKGGEWKETNKFTYEELLKLRAVIDKAILEEEVKVD
jgi:N-methylhydantoinase A/oxoprolinase/acetone carboxylase beta subunit